MQQRKTSANLGAPTFALQGSFSQCWVFSSSILVCSLPFPVVLGVEAKASAPVTCSMERRLPDLQSILVLYITECKGINLSLHLGLHQKQSVKNAFSLSLRCLGNFAGSQLTLTLFLFSSQQMCEWRECPSPSCHSVAFVLCSFGLVRVSTE